MDVRPVGHSIISFFVLMVSVFTGTARILPEPAKSVTVEEKEESLAYHYQLEGPQVHEATDSFELEYSEEIIPTTVPLSTSLDLTKTVMGATSFPTPTSKPSSPPTPTLEPTATPTMRPTNTPQPTNPPTATPTVESTPTAQPSPINLNIPVANQSDKPSLNADTVLQLINDHRASKSLVPFVKDDQLCKLAEYRKSQLYDEIFVTRSMHKGLYDLKLPYFITENMAHYSSEQKVVSWWLGSRIHRSAIEGDYTYSCGACLGNSCAQLFTNFTPKAVR